jgi:hypothetical protein
VRAADADSTNVCDGSGETLASFEVYVSSPDGEAEKYFVRTIQEFDSQYGSSNVSGDGDIAREVRESSRGTSPQVWLSEKFASATVIARS